MVRYVVETLGRVVMCPLTHLLCYKVGPLVWSNVLWNLSIINHTLHESSDSDGAWGFVSKKDKPIPRVFVNSRQDEILHFQSGRSAILSTCTKCWVSPSRNRSPLGFRFCFCHWTVRRTSVAICRSALLRVRAIGLTHSLHLYTMANLSMSPLHKCWGQRQADIYCLGNFTQWLYTLCQRLL